MKTKLFLFLAVLSVPVFAVNNLNESFDGAFDLPWNTWGSGTFSSTTYDLAGSKIPDSGIQGVFSDDWNVMGSGGSWAMETVWTGLTISSNLDDLGELTMKTQLESGYDTDIRIQFFPFGDGTASLSAYIWDASVSGPHGPFQIITGPGAAFATLPSDITLSMELTVHGPQDWQMDFYYDSGSGKTSFGFLRDEDMDVATAFDPTTQRFRQQLYLFTHGTATVNTASLDNWNLTPVISGDVDGDGDVDLDDFTGLALQWLNDNCAANSGCQGADLYIDSDDTVNFLDFSILAKNLDGVVILENEKARIKFDRESASVLEVYFKESNIQLIEGVVTSPAIRVRLEDGTTLTQPDNVTFLVYAGNSQPTIVSFEFNQGIEVTAEVLLSQAGDITFSNIIVDSSASGKDVKSVDYPVIRKVGNLGGNPENYYFLSPIVTGYLIRDPIASLTAHPGASLRDSSGQYPVGFHVPVQMLALYQKNQGGFVLMTQDPNADYKEYECYPESGKLELSVRHFNSHTDSDLLSVNYATRLAPLNRGDWFEAAEIYRDWALTAPWSAKGPNQSRSDAIDWLFGDVGLCYFAACTWQGFGPPTYFNSDPDFIPFIHNMENATGNPMFFIWSNSWQDGGTTPWNSDMDSYIPIRRDPVYEIFETVKAGGHRHAFFEFNVLWNMNNTLHPDITDSYLLGENQTPLTFTTELAFVCPSTTAWQDFAFTKDKYLYNNFLVDGFYHDVSACAVAPRHCYDISHPHGTRSFLKDDYYALEEDDREMAITVTQGANDYQSLVNAEPSLISYYTFDNDTSLATDTASGGHNGTLAGTGWSFPQGVIGSQCLDITEDSWVQFGSVTDFEFTDGSGTVECLIRKEVAEYAAFRGTLFSMRDGWDAGSTRYQWDGDRNDNRMTWLSWGNTSGLQYVEPDHIMNSDQWYHVAFVCEGGVVRDMYVNGTPLALASHPALGNTTGVTVQFGSVNNSSKAEGWIGKVDELAVYGNALSQATIAQHADVALAGISGPDYLAVGQEIIAECYNSTIDYYQARANAGHAAGAIEHGAVLPLVKFIFGQPMGGTGRTFQIGSVNNSNKAEGWIGKIDELAVYGDVLSPATIQAHVDVADANNYQTLVNTESSLISYYTFDSDSIQVTDTQGSHHGTLQGDPAFPTGRIGSQCLELDSSDWVQFGAISDFDFLDGSGTVECWVYPMDDFTSQGRGAIFSGRDGWGTNSTRYDFSITDSLDSVHWVSYGNDGAPVAEYSHRFEQNQWYHLAFVCKDGLLEAIYINGQPAQPLARKVPLFDYIYHTHGPVRLDGWAMPDADTGPAYYASLATTALWGGIPEFNAEGTGWYLAPSEVDPDMVNFAAECSKARCEFGRDYLCYGKMVPFVDLDMPQINLDYTLMFVSSTRSGTTPADPVVTSAYEYGNKVAYFFCNITDTPIQLDITIDPVIEGLSYTSRKIRRVDSSGSSGWQNESPENNFTIVEELPSRRIIMYEVVFE